MRCKESCCYYRRQWARCSTERTLMTIASVSSTKNQYVAYMWTFGHAEVLQND